jgi:hypothetical protein
MRLGARIYFFSSGGRGNGIFTAVESFPCGVQTVLSFN